MLPGFVTNVRIKEIKYNCHQRVSSKIRTSSIELFHAFILFPSRSIRWNVPRLSEEPTRSTFTNREFHRNFPISSTRFHESLHVISRFPFEIHYSWASGKHFLYLLFEFYQITCELTCIVCWIDFMDLVHALRINKSKQICLQYVF